MLFLMYFLLCCIFLSSVEDALGHPYLASIHDVSNEPICPKPFNFDIEEDRLTENQIRDLIYQEALYFNPKFRQ